MLVLVVEVDHAVVTAAALSARVNGVLGFRRLVIICRVWGHG